MDILFYFGELVLIVLIAFKYHGLLGKWLKHLVCRSCGAVRYHCAAKPHRLSQARRYPYSAGGWNTMRKA